MNSEQRIRPPVPNAPTLRGKPTHPLQSLGGLQIFSDGVSEWQTVAKHRQRHCRLGRVESPRSSNRFRPTDASSRRIGAINTEVWISRSSCSTEPSKATAESQDTQSCQPKSLYVMALTARLAVRSKRHKVWRSIGSVEKRNLRLLTYLLQLFIVNPHNLMKVWARVDQSGGKLDLN